MKVAVLMLSYERYDTFKMVLDHNLKNAGHPFDLFIWDNGSQDYRVKQLARSIHPYSLYLSDNNVGIAKALNIMMDTAIRLHKYDAVHFMANDILESKNWLSDKVKYLKAIPESGMISICPGEHMYPYGEIAGRPAFVGDVIGNCMISRQVYDAVGKFREDFGRYGPIDNDYNVRCQMKGFVNYYIPGKSTHLDDHNNTLYGYDKAASVQATWPVHVASIQEYINNPGRVYIAPDGETTMNMAEYVP
ncbi:glycosyltransferase family 2 protein [Chitinophaga sp. sic0106]|uniref:glycosyltransferase family 2 protein n=1 Tax=Chitinophaga sp. sic0106 TaxID=2854785 RepID=UPI001C449DDC|nr:glycosyltransferase [Chitinophaga sp. sic0106]MBV7534063.1 glycosyltransferase [Chitinophaga sp. sic0106]